MRISPWQSAFQRGSALVISIFFLLLLATLALTGLRASTTNVQIVGNMQARQEVTAAAQMLLEQTLSSDEFARNSQGVYAAARVEGDFNGDGVSDAVAVLAEPPRCLRARSVAFVDLDPDNPVDAPCFASAAITNPGLHDPEPGHDVTCCRGRTQHHMQLRTAMHSARLLARIVAAFALLLVTAVSPTRAEDIDMYS